MRRHPKAPSAGSIAKRRAGGLCLLATAWLLLLVPSAPASFGVDAYWGSITGTEGATPTGGRFGKRAPNGIAVYAQTGDVYVADGEFNRIQQFDEAGQFIRAWGFDVESPAATPPSFEVCAVASSCKAGSTAAVSGLNPGGQLSNPMGVAVNQANGHVYVNDRGFNRIQEFRISDNGTPGDPVDDFPVFVRAFGQDVIVNSGSPANSNGTGFEVCDTTTTPANTAGDCKAGTSSGGSGGVISSTNSVGAYLAVAPEGAPNEGKLLVADPNRNRIQEFTATGSFVRTFGGGVVNAGAAGTGNVTSGSKQITGVTTTDKFFVVGQLIVGAGIPAGTQIESVAAGGIINLTQAVTATNAATPLSVAAGAGNVANNETQQISLSVGVVSGNFKLSFTTPVPNNTTAGANTTVNIPFDATAGTVQAALEGVGNIGAGNVAVTGPAGGPWAVEFVGKYADTNVNLLGVAAGAPALSTGTAAGSVLRSVIVEGASGFEVCTSLTECQGGVAGTDPGQFRSGNAARVAEDPSGNIYTLEVQEGGEVALQGIQKFTQAGSVLTAEGPFACALLCGDDSQANTRNNSTNLAVDAQGFLYVSKAFRHGEGEPPAEPDAAGRNWQDRVLKVDPAGNLVLSILANAGLEPGVEGDPGGSQSIAGISGLAVTPSGSRLYVSTAFEPLGLTGRSRVYRASEIQGPSGSVSTGAVGATAATLEGTVNPAETLGHVKTLYRFEYRRAGTSAWLRVPDADVNLGNGSAGGESNACSPSLQSAVCHVSGEIDRLELGRTYQYRLVARTSYQGSVYTTPPQEFTTVPVPPAVTTGGAVWSGPPSSGPSLTFNGSLNPQGANTGYAFEYVSQADFEASGFANAQRFPLGGLSAGHGTKAVEVTAVKGGLDPGSEYQFRLVASNPSGSATGERRSVAPSRAGDRFVELVSAGDSQGGDVSNTVAVSDDGERAAFTAVTFGDQQAAPWIVTSAIAQRGQDGWEARAVSGDPESTVSNRDREGGIGDAAVTQRLWGTAPEPQTLQWVVREFDGTLTPVSSVISPLDRTGPFGVQFFGGSEDLSTVVFGSEGATLFPGEPLLQGAGASNIYKVSGADATLVNRADDGDTIGGACGARFNGVSADGSTVYFSASSVAPAQGSCGGGGTVGGFFPGMTTLSVTSGSFSVGQLISGQGIAPGTTVIAVDPGANTITISPGAEGFGGIFGTALTASFPTQVFKRVGEAAPVEISACAKAPPATCSGGVDRYEGASADGSKVVFSTSRQLNDTDGDSTADLYLHDSSPPSGEPSLVQVSAGEDVPGAPGDPLAHETGKGAEVLGIVDLARDGSRVYFVAKGRLTADGVAGAVNLYVFQRDADHPSGRVEWIASVEGDTPLWNGKFKQAYALPRYDGLGSVRQDGDGHMLLFASSRPLLPGVDQDSVADIYRYDDISGQLECVSCAGDDSLPAEIAERGVDNVFPDSVQKERAASEDGSKVVFQTGEALLPVDTNAEGDAYLWEDGALSLISGATGDAGTAYIVGTGPAISPDGSSVFFSTRAGLLPQDQDAGAIDIYAARIDGGFPQLETSVPCASEAACRKLPYVGSAPASSPGSAGFTGAGNVKSKKCAKKRVLRGNRCVKSKNRKHKKHRAHKQKRGKGKKQSRTGSGRRTAR